MRLRGECRLRVLVVQVEEQNVLGWELTGSATLLDVNFNIGSLRLRSEPSLKNSSRSVNPPMLNVAFRLDIDGLGGG